MKLYHGTNSNAIEGLAKSNFTLFSRRKFSELGEPLFTGEVVTSGPYTPGNSVDTVSLGSRRDVAVKYALSSFSYMNLRKQRDNLLKKKKITDQERVMLRIYDDSLRHFSELPFARKRRVSSHFPVILEVDCDPKELGDYEKSDLVGGLQYQDSVTLRDVLVGVQVPISRIDLFQDSPFKVIGRYDLERRNEVGLYSILLAHILARREIV